MTGAASGIGCCIADRFSKAGAAVAVFDIDAQGAREAAAAIPQAIALTGDVSREDDARAGIENTVAAFGRLDVLVNNAAIELNGDVAGISPTDWDRQMAVNLRGAYLFSHFAIPQMRVHGGSILNISSVHAMVSWPGCAAYDASKAGLLGLTRAMALDHGRDGIRVNAITPGYIDTPLMQKALRDSPDRETALAQIIAAHPVGRLGTPADVAAAALFLASETASFITGVSLVVDGGVTLAGH